MPRLIDANRIVYSWTIDNDGEEHDGVTLQSIIDKMPTVDAEPVRHGHWCVTQAYPHTVYCSECFKRFAQAHWQVWEDGSLPRDYCPNCGAKMDGDMKLEE